MSDTIAAVSTPAGEGGIGILRVSGDGSIEVMEKLMRKFPENPEPRHAYLSSVNGFNNDFIDQAIFMYMKKPYSYTGEDMLEIQAHGNNFSLKNILRKVLYCGVEGIRMAEPGEFTKLAFLNGKMDLSQAEAVMDIIKAKSDYALSVAESQREGRLGNVIKDIRNDLLEILAEMAVNIDYPDEDIDQVQYDELSNKLRWVSNSIDELLDTASVGRIMRDGIRIAIAGRPNVGKSSLMNAILGEGRVIVTDVPGTTRDTVEESVTIDGIPVVLIDTAGLRETDDLVEKIGIKKAEHELAAADLIMLVVDGSTDFEEEDNEIFNYILKMNSRRVMVIINKSDLGICVDEEVIRSKLPEAVIINTSLVGKAVNDAVSTISEELKKIYNFESYNNNPSNIITNERHVKLLKNSRMNIEEAIEMLQNGEPLEVAELSAHYAYNSLGYIIGEEIGDDVINAVFSKFCLGK